MPTITIAMLKPRVNTWFAVSGALSGYKTKPKLWKATDPKLAAPAGAKGVVSGKSIALTWQPVTVPYGTMPHNGYETTRTYSFEHEPMAHGAHMIAVTDGTVEVAARFTI